MFAGMHERSIAQAIFRQLTRTAGEYPGMRVVSCEVEIGPLSGVEPLLLEVAFETLIRELGHEIALEVRSVPLRGQCRTCQANVDLEALRFQCPICGSSGIDVISGDQVELAHVTVAEA